MRILLINQFYKPDTAATGQLLADVAQGLVASGHDVTVITSRNQYGGKALRQKRHEVLDGVHVRRVAGTRFGRERLIGRLLDYITFYVGATWCALIMRRPDVCLCLTTPPFISAIGYLLSKFKKTQNVIWVMDMYPEIAAAYQVMPKNSLVYRMLSGLNRILYRNAAVVISLGENMTGKLEALGARSESIHTVHNWVPGEGSSEAAV